MASRGFSKWLLALGLTNKGRMGFRVEVYGLGFGA